MKFHKINSYTRVLDDGKKTLQERKDLINKSSLSKSDNYLKDKKNRRPEDQLKLYRKFVNEVFQNRTFIGQNQFHTLILKKFNSSSTFYRRRMLELNLISQENKTIKPLKITDHEKNNVQDPLDDFE
jgi:hypothetical protein